LKEEPGPEDWFLLYGSVFALAWISFFWWRDKRGRKGRRL